MGDVPCFADEMGQARLAMGRMDGVITGIVIGDQSALKIRSEDGGGHLPGTGSVDVEETEIRGACIPEIGRLSVETPPRFVTMDNVSRMNLVAECLVMRFSGFGDGVGEGHCRGWDKGHGEEIAEDAAHITQGDLERMPEEDGGGLSRWTDLAVSQFALGSLVDVAAAGWTVGQIMGVADDAWTGLQDDIFLNLLMLLAGCRQAGGVAMRTDVGSRGMDGSIKVIRPPARPRWVSFGGAPLAGWVFVSRGWTVGFEA